MKKILFLSLVLTTSLLYSMMTQRALAEARAFSSKPWIYNPRLNTAIVELTQLQKQIHEIESAIQKSTPTQHDDYVYEKNENGTWTMAKEQPRVKEMLAQSEILRGELAQLHEKLSIVQAIYALERATENKLNGHTPRA